MKEQFKPLFAPITFKNGLVLKNRFAMAPMLVFASNEDGTVGQDDLDYFELRNNTGQLIISGAAAVSEEGLGMPRQLTVYDDKNLPGLTKLASLMKSKGNKAILQLHNAGREAVGAYQRYGKVLAPSSIDFPFLDYVPEQLSDEQIIDIIEDYGRATKRAIDAGFDGVEIHGANHYLLQQFFSAYSNVRTDRWGGSVEKRMTFPLAVTKKVLEVAAKYGDKQFLVGYRISPEEIHGQNVGYTIKESLQLIERVVETGVDYIHLSLFDYKVKPQTGEDEAIATIVRRAVNGRVPVIVVGNVLTAQQAADAIGYGDLVALGRGVIIDPEFAVKIETGQEDTIETSVAGRLNQLALSKTLVEFWEMENSPLPPLKGINV